MASLPLDPVYARLVLLSAEERFECAKEILVIVSMLSTDAAISSLPLSRTRRLVARTVDGMDWAEHAKLIRELHAALAVLL